LADKQQLVRPLAAEVNRLGGLLGDVSGLEQRGAALSRLDGAPRPDRVKHLWRFTDPANLVPAAESEFGGPDVKATMDPLAAVVVDLQPGRRPLITMGPAGREAGLEIISLAEAGALAQRMSETTPAPESAWFADLNEAAWNTGVAMRIPRGVVLSAPVRVVVHATNDAVLPRILVVAEATSEIEIVEEHRGGGAGTRVASVTGVVADAGSHVRHVVVQAWNAGVNGHLGVRTLASRDADVLSVFCVLGGDRAKLELITTLAGEGARSNMVGIILGADRQHLDVHTRHVHQVGHTRSDIDVKAVMTGHSRSSYTGLIRIEKEARETEAFQENRNLVLSGTARADTIPELEILNQDVKCSHGATVAPLDENQVFYLQSRGIEDGQARLMIVRGFLENTLARLPASLREDVSAIIDARLVAVEESKS